MECKQDAYTKSMILHSITRCVYLLESEVREGRQETPPHQPAPWGLPVPAPHPPDYPDRVLGPVSLMVGGVVLRGLGDRACVEGHQDTRFSCLFHLSWHTLGLCLY